MITGGDEIARTQGGSNNGWCQDNEISWLDWKNADHDLRMFTQRLIGLRRTEPVFRRSEFLQGNRTDSGVADVGWLRPDGEVMTDEDCTRALAVFLNGREIDEQDPEGREIRGHSFLLLVNANHEPVTFTLPTTSPEAGWTIELSTIAPERTDEGPVSAGDTLELPDRAMVILRRSQDRDLHVRPRQLRQAQPELGPRFDPYGHQVALFLALEGVADQPDQRVATSRRRGPGARRCRARPGRPSWRGSTTRCRAPRNQVRSTACARVAIRSRGGVLSTWNEFACSACRGVSLLGSADPTMARMGLNTLRSVPTGRS